MTLRVFTGFSGVRYCELSSAGNFGFEAGRFSPVASLECVYNFGVMA
jgi:hypothetical protein